MAESVNPSLIYAADDKPPLLTQIFLGLQHCMGMASTLALAIILLNVANVSVATKEHLIAATLFAVGFGSFLMCLKTRFLGSGFLCPLLCEPAFLAVSLLAVHMGGLPLLLGMTCVAGIGQILLSTIYPHARKLFPVEVVGVVVLIVGIALVDPDLVYSTGASSLNSIHWIPQDLMTSGATLLVMLTLVVWGRGFWMRYCMLFGIIVGFIVATKQGLLGASDYLHIWQAPLLASPFSLSMPHMSFDIRLLFPFVIAMIATTLKGVGGVINCQKTNDVTWVHPDQSNLKKSIFTNGLANCAAAFLGCMGLGVSNNNIGLAIATEVTSHYVGMVAGVLFMIFAFIPKISMLFVIMPKPVLGATLLFVTSYVIVGGLQLITSRMLDTRKIFVIGFSLIVGLAVEMAPQAMQAMPPALQTLAQAPIVSTTIIALVLSFIFRLGIAKEIDLDFPSPKQSAQKIKLFLEAQGRAWGADANVIARATMALIEVMEALAALDANKVNIHFNFDEYTLTITVNYEGEKLPLNPETPGHIDLKNNEAKFMARLAMRLLQEYTPDVQIAETVNNTQNLTLRFGQ